MSKDKPITFLYTNWKGETAQRTVIPKYLEFTSTEWHPKPQWILTAYDVDKEEYRGFAVKDIDKCIWIGFID